MKRFFLNLALLLFVGSISFAQNGGISFYGGNLEEACQKAKIENKRIFIDVYTDWCGPCKAVARYVFPTEEAGKYFNANFINLSIDAEKGIGVAIAGKFKVNTFPTFLVLDSDMNVLARWSGASMKPTPAGFIKKVEEQLALGPEGSAKEMEQLAMFNNARNSQQGEAAKPGIQEFEGTYAAAIAKAKAEGKMLFVDCYTQKCGPCKMMSAQVFPLKEVGDFMNPKFVFLKLDMLNGEGPELSKTLNIKAYPTYVILDGNGKEAFRFIGFMQADAFMAKINSHLDKNKTPQALQARYDAGDRDKIFLREYIGVLASENRPQEAGKVAAELMNSLTDEEKFAPEYWNYWTNYGYYGPEENFNFLIENQYKFKVGKKVVTDFLVSVASSNYSAITFDFSPGGGGSTQTAEELVKKLSDADELAKRLELEHNATVVLYRAAARAKISGDIDGMLDTYEQYANTIFSEGDQDSFLINIFFSFSKDLTPSQKERLATMARSDNVKTLFRGQGGQSDENQIK
jgi:thioredoxin-related protein